MLLLAAATPTSTLAWSLLHHKYNLSLQQQITHILAVAVDQISLAFALAQQLAQDQAVLVQQVPAKALALALTKWDNHTLALTHGLSVSLGAHTLTDLLGLLHWHLVAHLQVQK